MGTSNHVKDHDRWFKELISNFLEEFILAFFPNIYEYIDFKNTKFLSEEIFTDIVKGEKRRVDLLIETRLKGENAIIIIHIESQSYFQQEFLDRMFIYFSRLYEKYRRPIVPIAVFSYDNVKDEPDHHIIKTPFMHIVKFQYLTLELRKVKWREYNKYPNPVTTALLSKMGYDKSERVQVKIEFLRLMTKMGLDPARENLITGFFESYLRLSKQEEDKLFQELAQMPKKEENNRGSGREWRKE